MANIIFLNENKKVELGKNENIYCFNLEKNNVQASLLIDKINNRLRVLWFKGTELANILTDILELAGLNNLDKIWAVAAPNQWQSLFKWGYILEGILPKYFADEPAYYMAYFLNPERRSSSNIEKENELIRNLRSQDLAGQVPILPEGYEMRLGTPEDAFELAAFYDEIFPTYPTPMHDVQYVKKMMNSKVIFNLIFYHGKIIAAASADIEEKSGTAEMTDIACSPVHRGKKLPVIAIKQLEVKMREEKIKTLYTLARAKLPGINKAFFRLDYEYSGRLINNCDIFGGYEDMNLLVKALDCEN
ncbi:MAG: putative beta-lysine N-acetyltransferase [Peptococcaceae bacterium]